MANNMTPNDNIRHYIGDLEATEDIDLVFKHIYDLMLANGGEGSALNADMVDGYHASDFAPASLKQELDNCIQRIYLGGKKYEGQDVTIELLARYISIERGDDTINVETYLNDLNTNMASAQGAVNDIQNMIGFLESDDTRDALSSFVNSNIKYVTDEEGYREYYLDADSINGLSFMLVTQEQYDLLPKERKEDPRNIFIINDNLNTDFSNADYVPPSILKASMNLQFRINTATNNVEYSVDGGKRWAVLLPLVGTDTNKGLLHPNWFNLLNDYIMDNELLNQNDYPFLLNIPENTNKIEESISSIQLDGTTIISSDNQDGTADISQALDSYMTDWVNENRSYIQSKLTIPSINGLENASNKKTNISTYPSNTYYPTTQAVIDYTTNIKNNLQTSINNVNNKLSESGWQKINPYNVLFKGGPIYMKKIGKIVYFSGSVKTKTTVEYAGYDDYWNLFDIPDGFVPAVTTRIVAQCSATDRCLIYVGTNGAAQIGRFDYKNNRTGSYTLPKDYWITFSGTYFTN